jgi:transposase-like protein
MLITIEESRNIKECPCCKSKNIRFDESGCLCRIRGHSCWQHPVCGDCGFTSGPASGNSNRGIWVAFGAKPVKGMFEINQP